MSTSYSVNGYGREDEGKFNKMKTAYNACTTAGVDVPEPVLEYFNYQDPNVFPYNQIYIHEAVTGFATPNESGWRVDLTKLSPDVKIIEFKIS